jgi:hypothetical protein
VVSAAATRLGFLDGELTTAGEATSRQDTTRVAGASADSAGTRDVVQKKTGDVVSAEAGGAASRGMDDVRESSDTPDASTPGTIGPATDPHQAGVTPERSPALDWNQSVDYATTGSDTTPRQRRSALASLLDAVEVLEGGR